MRLGATIDDCLLDGLQDAKGRGRPPCLPPEKVEQVITGATQPPKPRTRWTVRTMARAVGMSPDSVHRIWKANDIKPHYARWRPRCTGAR